MAKRAKHAHTHTHTERERVTERVTEGGGGEHTGRRIHELAKDVCSVRT